jgi:hypothetical protein
MSPDDVRGIALSLAETVEAGHHGRPSFRVKGRIFATLWTPKQLNLTLDEPEILAATQSSNVCEVLLWGGAVKGVKVDLERADEALVRPLLEEAWARAAPRAVRRARLQP